jgi:acetyl-CoA C-acetyltransferase
MNAANPVVIVGAARTPIGGFLGGLKDVTAPELGARAIEAAIMRAGAPAEDVDDVIMGCVLSAGLGQAPARQASLNAGLPESAGCTTINKMCGSGMKAVMIAHDQIMAGGSRIVIAGGMESMSNAPYLLDRARQGYRMGHRRLVDHMFFDGLEDAYEKGRLMGSFAEDCATEYQFTREMQDEYALASLKRAQRAGAEGSFFKEIAAVAVRTGAGERVIAADELPAKAEASDIALLRPAFRDGGSVTAANSSAISDGAAALMLMRLDEAKRRGLPPLAIICGHVTVAGAPSRFPVMPIGAIGRLVERLGWTIGDVDLFEINEAFAAVVLAAMRDLDLPRDKVNIHGGACSLGHPIGASGARIIVTLLAALEKCGLKRGVAARCIGGDEATAIGVERMG